MNDKLKKYIIWADFRSEGWVIVFQTDDKELLLSEYPKYIQHDGRVVITQNLPLFIEIPNDN